MCINFNSNFPKIVASVFLIIGLISCKEPQNDINKDRPSTSLNLPTFSLIGPKESGLLFENRCEEDATRNVNYYDYFYNGAGVALGDFNNDGLEDIFLSGNDVESKLFLNKGELNFEDITSKAGFQPGKWATGVTTVDINNDGLLDIYVCYSGPDIATKDISNELYINNGDLTFTESASQYGINDNSRSTHAVFFDMDNDMDLDLFVLNHSVLNYGKSIQEWQNVLLAQDPDEQRRSCNTLYRNNGNGNFTDITGEAGLFRAGFGLGATVTDFDNNGFLDIYVTNDYFMTDYLYMNNGNGTFIDKIKEKFQHTSFYGMGTDAADFNNDGEIDLMVADMTPSDHFRSKTQMESMDVELFNYLKDVKKFTKQYMFNSLSINRGNGVYSEIANQSGVAKTDWSWAPLFMDIDNDGWKDIIVTNGFKRDTKDRDWRAALTEEANGRLATPESRYQHLLTAKSTPLINYVYKNNGDLSFQNISTEAGFNEPSFSQGAAYGDLDNDGDLDLVVNNLDQNAFLYRNNTSESLNNNYIQFSLSNGKTSQGVLNSKIKIYYEDQIQTVEYSFDRGFQSSMQRRGHFGLGNISKVDKAVIEWPEGNVTTIENPEINKKHHIDRNNAVLVAGSITRPAPLFFDISNQAKNITYSHSENSFDDFKKEILLPQKVSTLGPALTVGDVNGDGLEDFFVGGALGQAAEIYVQDPQQGFVGLEQRAFKADAKYEDIGAHFFDADGDGDLDLYVASGGGGDIQRSSLLQDRLYVNDGSGTFKAKTNNLPKINQSTMSISSSDWDGDGDLDLFVGGRNVPGLYPNTPQSYLLENNNGVFKNVTESRSKGLQQVGMITSSVWLDVNKDSRPDLIVAGEWTAVMVFLNTENGFENNTENAGTSENLGWWRSLTIGDFDRDGDLDIIAGNLGKNNKFGPTAKSPLHIFASDFDDNNTNDIVLSKDYKGALVPVRGKECSSEQMPFIGEKFPTYMEFASATLEDIYTPEKLSEALHLQVNTFSSMYLENNNDGTFTMKELPAAAQIAPINGSAIADYNKDGNLDLVVAGNIFNTEPETPAYDAGKGLVMLGNGDGTFTASANNMEQGLFMGGNVKNLALIKITNRKQPAFVVANNNAPLQVIVSTK